MYLYLSDTEVNNSFPHWNHLTQPTLLLLLLYLSYLHMRLIKLLFFSHRNVCVFFLIIWFKMNQVSSDLPVLLELLERCGDGQIKQAIFLE